MTAGDKLRNLSQRHGGFLTSRQITDPRVRALYWKRELWQARDILENLGSDPSHERDVWIDEYWTAKGEYLSALTAAIDARKLSRMGRAA